jgi:hypothetical protein
MRFDSLPRNGLPVAGPRRLEAPSEVRPYDGDTVEGLCIIGGVVPAVLAAARKPRQLSVELSDDVDAARERQRIGHGLGPS